MDAEDLVAEPLAQTDGTSQSQNPSPQSQRVVLSRVSIRRFKQFKSLDLDLSPGLSLVAGANNSGKSSLLHALAVWEFCRTATIMERGPEGLLSGAIQRQGLGLGDDEFSPINVPSLKHLWTNLKSAKTPTDGDGYTLSISVAWSVDDVPHSLGFALSLANDRLFIKVQSSDLTLGDRVPVFAYLPPFAGITAREERVGGAIRRRRTGEGLAGAVLRNILLDMRQKNASLRTELKGTRRNLTDASLRRLREEDPWELLQQAMRTQFGAELQVDDFSEEYHSYIKVEVVKGGVEGYKLTKHPQFNARDLMVEGSGFLQWLSVYALAVTNDIDVLLLDEPDAHLHPSLQRSLLSQLDELAGAAGKQALIATHSAEILRHVEPHRILQIKGSSSARYLTEEHQKVALLEGIGSSFSPRFEKVRRYRKIFFHEGTSDLAILEHLAKTMGVDWPDNMATICTTMTHKERAILWRALKDEYGEDVVSFSLRDRDEEPLGTAGEGLKDSNYPDRVGFMARKWRRRHIEGYLIWPEAIAKATKRPVAEIRKELADSHGIAVTDAFINRDGPTALMEAKAKDVLASFKCSAMAVAKHLPADRICDDLRDIISEIADFARVSEAP